MCTTDVSPQAASALADLFDAIRNRLAAEHGCDPATIVIGPCDLGGTCWCAGRCQAGCRCACHHLEVPAR